MVEIRTLKPSVKIALPSALPRPRKGQIVVRRRADHPAPTPQPTPCVLWQGTIDDHGYGTWWRRDHRTDPWVKVRPHRWILELTLGRKLKADEVVLHACDQPLCFRADHLSVGTRADNNADMMRKGRYVHAGGKLPGHVKDRILRLAAAGLFIPTIAEEMEISKDAVRRTLKEAGVERNGMGPLRMKGSN